MGTMKFEGTPEENEIIKDEPYNFNMGNVHFEVLKTKDGTRVKIMALKDSEYILIAPIASDCIILNVSKDGN
jgi:hypothetical protein